MPYGKSQQELKDYFKDLEQHTRKYILKNQIDYFSLELAFGKRFECERKEWLSWFTQYHKSLNNEQTAKEISITDFVNREIAAYYNQDNYQSIPSILDGLVPCQRTILNYCLKFQSNQEIYLANLYGKLIAECGFSRALSFCIGSVVGMAQDFIGTNNINLFVPIGLFGTRIDGDKLFATLSHLKTKINDITPSLFKHESSIKQFNGINSQPDFYWPILPTILINGFEGIGRDWITKIPSFNPKDIIINIKRMINKKKPLEMKPYYKNFQGSIVFLNKKTLVTTGIIWLRNDNKEIQISELPISVSSEYYKKNVLEKAIINKSDHDLKILAFEEYHSTNSVKFIIKILPEEVAKSEKEGFHKYFQLQKLIFLNDMVLFDCNGVLRRFENANKILESFFNVACSLYSNMGGTSKWLEDIDEFEKMYDNLEREKSINNIDSQQNIPNQDNFSLVKSIINFEIKELDEEKRDSIVVDIVTNRNGNTEAELNVMIQNFLGNYMILNLTD
jgi:DNA topoisomerase II